LVHCVLAEHMAIKKPTTVKDGRGFGACNTGLVD